LLATIWLAGCSGSRELADRPDLPDAFPNHTLAQIQQNVDTPAADTLSTLKAKTSLTIRTPEQSASLSADLNQRRSDSLYMSLSPGLGIEAARVLITPDSFYVYDRIKKQLTYGSLAYASSFLPASLTGEDVFLTLLGFNVPDGNIDWEVTADSALYQLRDPSGRYQYTIDPTVWRVVRYEERTPSGDMLETRTFSDFDLIGGLFLPRRINLERPLDDTRIMVYYRDLTLNTTDLAFDLRVNDSAKRILVDEQHGSSK
ncbi:MAG TPA: DUF4292 domain-containing protein, partial [Rhodothermales bacterium]|nr:DUF4292 domain-containing protein [Rhodothermales bacterium]